MPHFSLMKPKMMIWLMKMTSLPEKSIGCWMRGICCFFDLLLWKLSSPRRKFLHVCRSNGKGRKCCSPGLYNTKLQAMMYVITSAHSLWSERDLCYSDTAEERKSKERKSAEKLHQRWSQSTAHPEVRITWPTHKL